MKKTRIFSTILASLLLFSTLSTTVSATKQVPQAMTKSNRIYMNNVYSRLIPSPGEKFIYASVGKNQQFPKDVVIKLVATVNGKQYTQSFDRYSGAANIGSYMPTEFAGIVHLDTPLKSGDTYSFHFELSQNGHTEKSEKYTDIVDDENRYTVSPIVLPTPIIENITEHDKVVSITIPNADKLDFTNKSYILSSGFENVRFGGYNTSITKELIDENNEIVIRLTLFGQGLSEEAYPFDKFSAALYMHSYDSKIPHSQIAVSNLTSTIVNEKYPLTNYEIDSPKINSIKKADTKITGSTTVYPYYLGDKVALNAILKRADGTKITTPINLDGSFSIPVNKLKEKELLNIFVQASYNGVSKSGPTTAVTVGSTDQEKIVPPVKPDPKPSPQPIPEPKPTPVPEREDKNKEQTKSKEITKTTPEVSKVTETSQIPSSAGNSATTSAGSSFLPQTGDKQNQWLIAIGFILLIGAICYPIYQWKKPRK